MKFSKEMLEILDIEDKYDSLVKGDKFIKKPRRLKKEKLKSKIGHQILYNTQIF